MCVCKENQQKSFEFRLTVFSTFYQIKTSYESKCIYTLQQPSHIYHFFSRAYNEDKGARGVRISSLERDTEIRVQILNEAVCISRTANTFGKGTNLSILVTANSKADRPL